MPSLVIQVSFTDPSDLDWCRTRAVAVVEELIEETKDEGRIDGEVEVSWEIEDD